MSSKSFQNTITNQIAEQPSMTEASNHIGAGAFGAEPVPETSTSLVETYADRLMDELFEDVEQVLRGGVKLPEEPIKPDHVSLQPLKIPQFVLPSSLMPRPPEDETAIDTLLEQPGSELENRRKSRRSFDRLLLGAGCVALLASLGVWLFMQQRTQPKTATAPVTNAKPTKQQSDSQFMTYMQRALEGIQDSGNSKSSTVATAPSPGATLPSVPVKGTATPTSSPKPATPQRIYIPVYQAPPTSGTTNSAPSSVVLVPGTPTTARPSAPVAPSAPTVAHTLTGLLQLGDRSAALFEINGVTQRFQIGESIGTSGWTLVEISKSQAIVRRNGEVRSIFVGQKI